MDDFALKNETNNWMLMQDPKAEDMPSARFGPLIFLGCFLGLVLLAVFLVMGILWGSNKQEQVSSNYKDGRLHQPR